MKLIDKHTELSQSAIQVIKDKLETCGGNFVFFDKESAFNEDDEELEAEFLDSTFEYIADSQWDTNESCYLLKIVSVTDGFKVWGITESGEVIVTSLLDLESTTLFDLADFIATLPQQHDELIPELSCDDEDEDDRIFSAADVEEFAIRMVLYALDNETYRTPGQIIDYIKEEVKFATGDDSFNTYPMPERD